MPKNKTQLTEKQRLLAEADEVLTMAGAFDQARAVRDLADACLAQQRVIEAARRLIWISEQGWGVSADTATHDAWANLCEAVAAVSVGSPETRSE